MIRPFLAPVPDIALRRSERVRVFAAGRVSVPFRDESGHIEVQRIILRSRRVQPDLGQHTRQNIADGHEAARAVGSLVEHGASVLLEVGS